jgi:hypothetical protein
MAKLSPKRPVPSTETEVLDRLHEAGVCVSHDDLLNALLQALDELVFPVKADGVGHPLTPQETTLLKEGGFDVGTEPLGIDEAFAQTAIDYAALLATSLSVLSAARLLQVDASRIRQRLTARTLYGLKSGHAWRLPLFQFESGHVIPGVEKVFPQLSPDLHPIAVYAWFTLPDPELSFEHPGDEPLPLSPREWLLSGGNPDVVAEIAASL